MNTKTYITLCYLTGYVIAPVLSILMVIGAMTIIRSDNASIDNTTAIALNV
tara:strand:+ start:420 stop:572 length:153 start_codon:yes stop_codon:yes gene_type:complete